MDRETPGARASLRIAVRLLVVAAAGCFVLLYASAASASEIEVTTTTDEFDSATPNAQCSLREAVQTANINDDFGGCVRTGTGLADTIRLQGGSTYERSRDGTDDTNAAGDLDILGPTTIEVGGGGRAIIDGNDMDRVIDVAATLKAARLIVRNGTSDPDQPDNDSGGGGIAVTTVGHLVLRASTVLSNDAPTGGGILSRGVAALDKVRVLENHASDGGGTTFFGGSYSVRRSTIADNTSVTSAAGVFAHDGTGSIVQSTISGNTASGDSGSGGGLYFSKGFDQDTALKLVNVTISGNSSNGGGGGILAYSGMLTLNAVTVTDNRADANGNGAGFIAGSGGGISGIAIVKNSIIAGNLATNANSSDCYETNAVGHNLVGKGTGCGAAETTTVRQDPKLKPLADNGGPTQTHALRADSAAIGRAGEDAPARDQRGVRRGNDPDLGAFEKR